MIGPAFGRPVPIRYRISLTERLQGEASLSSVDAGKLLRLHIRASDGRDALTRLQVAEAAKRSCGAP